MDKRDTAIGAALDAYAFAGKAALETRKISLKAALSNVDTKMRRDGIKKAWRVYSSAIKNARKAFGKERKALWNQFRKDRDVNAYLPGHDGNSCGKGAAAVDRSTAAVDNAL